MRVFVISGDQTLRQWVRLPREPAVGEAIALRIDGQNASYKVNALVLQSAPDDGSEGEGHIGFFVEKIEVSFWSFRTWRRILVDALTSTKS